MRAPLHALLVLVTGGPAGCDTAPEPSGMPDATSDTGDPNPVETSTSPSEAGSTTASDDPEDPGRRDDGSEATGEATEPGTTGPATITEGSTGAEATSDTGEGGSSGTLSLDDDIIFSESFEGGMANAWPAPWQPLGGLSGYGVDGIGRGWLRSEGYTVARMHLPGYAESNVDMAATITFGDFGSQGVGLYARQNGGYLTEGDPPGAGYVAYLEGGYLESIGIWREHEGIEEPLHQELLATPLLDGVPYRLRFQCEQVGSVTHLRARVWPVDELEPMSWDVEFIDDTSFLQDVADGFTIDQFNYMDPVDLFIDDIEIRALP